MIQYQLYSTTIKSCIIIGLQIGLPLTFCTACRALGGPDDYDSQEIFVQEDLTPIEEKVPEGQRRLGIGAFYEGPTNETVSIDGVQNHFYIYEGTFSITEDSDRIEGVVSDQVTHLGGAWWGGGIHWDIGRDLSEWRTLHISLKANERQFENLKLAMNNENDRQTSISVTAYGFKADATWYELEIPLQDFVSAGLDLSAIYAPLVLVGGAGEVGSHLWIDRVFLSTP